MSTEVWFRNPHNYIRELVEVGETKVAWDRGLLVKKGIDPIKHAELYYGSLPWRVLTVGSQGTAEYRPGCEIESPVAVYPTWVYGEDASLLEEMLAYPVSEDIAAVMDTTVSGDERPVPNQEHRVVITEIPNTHLAPGRSFIRFLRDIQEEYPKAIIHIHGLYGWSACFGNGFGAADVDPRITASKGKVQLPSGSTDKYERLTQKPQWATAMGFKPSELSVPRNRCIYNIKSAVWAGQNYMELVKFRLRGGEPVDHTSPDLEFVALETKSYSTSKDINKPGDRQICDTCSLKDKCKYFRDGAVCTVPGADPVPLAKMFNTRNADDIIDGLSTLVSANAARMERGIRFEQSDGDLNPEVSKMIGQVFDQGVKLAKLIEPSRFAGGTKVQVNVGTGAASVANANPRQLVAATIQELVRSGIPRDQITPEMIQGALEGMIDPERKQKAIQGTVINEEAS